MLNKHFKPLLLGITLGAILLTGIVFWYFSATKRTPEDMYIVKNGALVEEVKSIGAVKPAKSVDLSFEKSGRIVYVGADVGDEVIAGKVLASLDSADILAQINQAKANVEAQNAKLNELLHGARPEQIKIQETAIAGASSAFDQATKAIVTQIKNSYVSADSVIHGNTDNLFNNPKSVNPTLAISISDSSLKNSLESARLALEDDFNSWNQSFAYLNGPDFSSSSDLSKYILETENNLANVSDFLGRLAIAINSAVSDSRFSQSVIDTYKTSIAGSRSLIGSSETAIVSAESVYKGAESALTLAKNQLSLMEAGGVSDDVKIQQALVDQANAGVQNLAAQLAKTAIRAPFAGKVTKQDVKVGQISTPNIPVVSIISNTNFQIETYVPEIDLAKIKINDSASVTLDAYGNSVLFNASVIKIDPAETVLNGVASYKITLQFSQNDEKIKSGMTANVDIHSANETSAIVIPKQSVITEGNENYVLLSAKNGVRVLQKIVVGKEGSNGMVEVLSGLKVGDKIASFSNQVVK